MLYGKRGNCQLIEYTAEYEQVRQKYYETEETFAAKLKELPEIEDLYRNVLDQYIAVNSEMQDIFYSEGFRFGVLIGLDVAGLIKE